MADLSSGNDTIKVIGAGFGRTGTNSLRVALNALGYNTYHMFEVMKYGDEMLWYNEINKPRKNRNFTKNIFKKRGYTACVDFPAASQYVLYDILETYAFVYDIHI